MRVGLRDSEANWRVAFALLGTLCIHALTVLLLSSRVTFRPPVHGDVQVAPPEVLIELPGAESSDSAAQPGSATQGVEEGVAGSSRAPHAAAAESSPSTLTDDERGEAGATSPRAPSATSPRLTLEQLGVGSSTSLLVDPEPPPPSQKKDAAYYSEKLNRSLANSIAQENQRDGAGPEVPVVTRLIRIAQQSDLPSDSSALLAVTADGAGSVSRLDVVWADGAPREWRRIANELHDELHSTRLRVQASRGVRFTIRVNARNQMPSGADPDAAVSVGGIPVSPGKGQHPSRADLLNPLAAGNVMTLSFDVADIGATARRVVHAHLESLEVLSALPDAAPLRR